jgi:hypothetical protein
MGKYSDYKDEVQRIQQETGWGSRKIARKIIREGNLTMDAEKFATAIRKNGWLKDSIVSESLHRNNLYPTDNWKVSWIKDKETGTSTLIQNPDFDKENTITLEDIEQVVEKLQLKKRKPQKKKKSGDFAFRGITADEHIGLEPNPNGEALFNYKYDAEIFKDCMNRYLESIVSLRDVYGRAEIIYIDCLGDTMDGWNAQTVRGGHTLPQNLTNKEAFELAVQTKVQFVDDLVQEDVADIIEIRTVTNDNHGGDFSWTVAKTVELICKRIYGDYVIFRNPTKFIEHFFYGEHCFMLCHGKDGADRKRGLPLRLDDKTLRFIRSYMDYHHINAKYNHFDKGDLHTTGFDRTKLLNYRNYLAFSPPSKWVQNNFGDAVSGYATQVVPKDSGEIIHTDYFFEFDKI